MRTVRRDVTSVFVCAFSAHAQHAANTATPTEGTIVGASVQQPGPAPKKARIEVVEASAMPMSFV